jgi:uncharacterized membrane protein YqiK
MLGKLELWPGLSASAGVYAFGVLAQATTTTGVDWLNVGAVGAITLLFAYIITKRDPAIQEKHSQTIQHHIDKEAETIKYLADKEAERDKHRADKEAERQQHLAQVFASETQSQREQFNLWMGELTKLLNRENCENYRPKIQSPQ